MAIRPTALRIPTAPSGPRNDGGQKQFCAALFVGRDDPGAPVVPLSCARRVVELRKASLLEGGAERSEAEGEPIPPPRFVQRTAVFDSLPFPSSVMLRMTPSPRGRLGKAPLVKGGCPEGGGGFRRGRSQTGPHAKRPAGSSGPTGLRWSGRGGNLYSPPVAFGDSPLEEGAFEGCNS